MRKHMVALVAGLLVALNACAPTLDGNGEAGGTIHSVKPWPGASTDTTSMAEDYCRRFNRSAHIAHEDLGWGWSDTVAFDCI